MFKNQIKNDFLVIKDITPLESAYSLIADSPYDIGYIIDKGGDFIGFVVLKELFQGLKKNTSEIKYLEDYIHSFDYFIESEDDSDTITQKLLDSNLNQLPTMSNKKVTGILLKIDVLEFHFLEKKKLSSSITKLEIEKKQSNEMLNILFHDLRTPINIVDICCQYLNSPEGNLTPLTVDQKSFIERINNSNNKISKQVSDIHEICSFTEVHLKYGCFPINRLFKQLAQNISHNSLKDRITFPKKIDSKLTMVGDFDRLFLSIENLLISIIKSTSDNSTIQIFLDVTPKNLERNDLKIRFKIADASKIDEKLFNIINKDSSISLFLAKKIGIGFEMAISNQYIALHQGCFEVEPIDNYSFEFSIQLPNTKNSDPNLEISSNLTKLLMVEDDLDILEYIKDSMPENLFQIITATNGKEALDKFRRFQPDIILSDIKMPEMDGLELLATIRMENKEIPIVLCSGFYPNLSEDLARSTFQATSILQKPYTANDIVDCLQNLGCISQNKKVS